MQDVAIAVDTCYRMQGVDIIYEKLARTKPSVQGVDTYIQGVDTC